MYQGSTVFAQLMNFLSTKTFEHCVKRYQGEHRVRSFSCWDQFLCMTFAQVTGRQSLRGIEVSLNAIPGRLYHMGIRGQVSRSTLADANETRDWRIYADFGQELIRIARQEYAASRFALELDRGYFDAERLFRLHQRAAFFVIRTKKNLRFRRLYSKATDRSTGEFCDQWIRFDGIRTRQAYPDRLRRVRFYDEENQRHLTFYTNNFVLPPLTIARLYKYRWQVEIFFKWIKSNLHIKRFYGTSVNAVKTQIWVAITVYVLAALVKKRLNLDRSLHEILHILSVTMFEKIPLLEALTKVEPKDNGYTPCNRLKLFDF